MVIRWGVHETTAWRAGGSFGQIPELLKLLNSLFPQQMKFGVCNGFKIQMPFSFKRWQTKVIIAQQAEHGREYMYAAPMGI